MRAAVLVLASMLVLGALTAASASASGPVWAYCGKTVPRNTGAYTDKACSIESPSHEGKWELIDGIGKGKGFKGKLPFGDFRIDGMIPPGELNLKCKKASISGHPVAPNKVAGVHISGSKCEYNISATDTCSFSTTSLSGELGWLSQGKGEAGIKLTSEAEPETGLITEVQTSCVPEAKQRWRGTAIGAWGPVGQLTKEPTLAYTARLFREEGNPRDMVSNPTAFEGEEGIHILRSEVNDPENGFEWSTEGGNAGAFEGFFQLKGEALMIH
jgi:hypothetical protein